MNPSNAALQCSTMLMLVLQVTRVSAGTQFSSHVTVNTPSVSYSHGVGDPVTIGQRGAFRNTGRRHLKYRAPAIAGDGRGYPRIKPSIPFSTEDARRSNGFRTTPYLHNHFKEINIPLLPTSPYKVDSPDPESLWPEGLFLPPIKPLKFGSSFGRRSDSEASLDPYLLQGSEAIAAVQRARDHGLYYFHDVPHIESLFANQDLRLQNHLEPLRIASIRHTWPYNRQ